MQGLKHTSKALDTDYLPLFWHSVLACRNATHNNQIRFCKELFSTVLQLPRNKKSILHKEHMRKPKRCVVLPLAQKDTGPFKNAGRGTRDAEAGGPTISSLTATQKRGWLSGRFECRPGHMHAQSNATDLADPGRLTCGC